MSSHSHECPYCNSRLRIAPDVPHLSQFPCPDCKKNLLLKRGQRDELSIEMVAEATATLPTVAETLSEFRQADIPVASRVNSVIPKLCLLVMAVLMAAALGAGILFWPSDDGLSQPGQKPDSQSPVIKPETLLEKEQSPPAPVDGVDTPKNPHSLEGPRIPLDLTGQLQQRLTAAGQSMQKSETAVRSASSPSSPPTLQRPLSWIAEMVAQSSSQSVDWKQNWDAPANDAFVRQPLSDWLNPLIPNQISLDRYPSTHFVGLSGIWLNDAKTGEITRLPGWFSAAKGAEEENVDQANTIAVVGINEQFPSWADGTQTSRWMTKEPYINGPDHIGTGQLDGMYVLMADGSVRLLSSQIEAEVLTQLATTVPHQEISKLYHSKGDPGIPPESETPHASQTPVPNEKTADQLALEQEFEKRIHQRMEVKVRRFTQASPVPLNRMLIEFETLLGTQMEFSEEVPIDDLRRTAGVTIAAEHQTVGEILLQMLAEHDLKLTFLPSKLVIEPRE